MGNLKRILKVGIFGTILGAILGIFYAKKPGDQTREELKEKIEDTKEKAIAAAREAAEKVQGIRDEVKEGVDEVKEIFSGEGEEKEQ